MTSVMISLQQASYYNLIFKNQINTENQRNCLGIKDKDCRSQAMPSTKYINIKTGRRRKQGSTQGKKVNQQNLMIHKTKMNRQKSSSKVLHKTKKNQQKSRAKVSHVYQN